jgi:hypothetical protein
VQQEDAGGIMGAVVHVAAWGICRPRRKGYKGLLDVAGNLVGAIVSRV